MPRRPTSSPASPSGSRRATAPPGTARQTVSGTCAPQRHRMGSRALVSNLLMRVGAISSSPGKLPGVGAYCRASATQARTSPYNNAGRARSGLVGRIPARPQQQHPLVTWYSWCMSSSFPARVGARSRRWPMLDRNSRSVLRARGRHAQMDRAHARWARRGGEWRLGRRARRAS